MTRRASRINRAIDLLRQCKGYIKHVSPSGRIEDCDGCKLVHAIDQLLLERAQQRKKARP